MRQRINRRKLLDQSKSKENHFEKKLKLTSKKRELINSLSNSKKNLDFLNKDNGRRLPHNYEDALKIYSKETSLIDQSTSFYRGLKFDKKKPKKKKSKKPLFKSIISYQNVNLFKDNCIQNGGDNIEKEIKKME